jgi:hypothetical protein
MINWNQTKGYPLLPILTLSVISNSGGAPPAFTVPGGAMAAYRRRVELALGSSVFDTISSYGITMTRRNRFTIHWRWRRSIESW